MIIYKILLNVLIYTKFMKIQLINYLIMKQNKFYKQNKFNNLITHNIIAITFVMIMVPNKYPYWLYFYY